MPLDKKSERELTQFFREFKTLPKDVQRETRPMLRQTADSPVSQAKRNASFSERIPGAIRVSLRFSKRFQGVTLQVNKNRAPHARPLENQGKPGQFRHRVFGKNVWVTQQARPFFYEVAEEWHDDVTQKLGQVIDRVTRSHKFK